MAKFKKKPVVVDTFLWTGGVDQEEEPKWIVEAMKGGEVRIVYDPLKLQIHTFEGVMTANPGDYIIQGVKGEMYPCEPNTFHMTHESVGYEVDKKTENIIDGILDDMENNSGLGYELIWYDGSEYQKEQDALYVRLDKIINADIE